MALICSRNGSVLDCPNSSEERQKCSELGDIKIIQVACMLVKSKSGEEKRKEAKRNPQCLDHQKDRIANSSVLGT